MSDLVGNPEDRFSRDESQFVSDSVHFIDYEYAMFNCEHYEIGHHFCFMAGKFSAILY